jgi:hypothetical protein
MAHQESEKQQVERVEQASSFRDGNEHADSHGFVADAEELPKGYFYSPFFLGTTCAVGFNLMVSNHI